MMERSSVWITINKQNIINILESETKGFSFCSFVFDKLLY